MEEILRSISYCPETGVFTWDVDVGRKVKKGVRAGSKSGGYRYIELRGVRYSEHRLAFVFMTGCMPKLLVDHINGDGCDNRWKNLRECSHSQNMQNLSGMSSTANKTSRFLGVSWRDRDSRWRAQIKINGRKIHLGHFMTELDARDAYLKAKRSLHVFNPIPRP